MHVNTFWARYILISGILLNHSGWTHTTIGSIHCTTYVYTTHDRRCYICHKIGTIRHKRLPNESTDRDDGETKAKKIIVKKRNIKMQKCKNKKTRTDGRNDQAKNQKEKRSKNKIKKTYSGSRNYQGTKIIKTWWNNESYVLHIHT